MALASTTTPLAAAPSWITVSPFTTTGCATVAENSWPAWLSLELSVSPSRTLMLLPAGMTNGAGVACASGPLPAAPGDPVGEAPGVSVEEEGVPDLLHPTETNSANNTPRQSKRADFT